MTQERCETDDPCDLCLAMLKPADVLVFAEMSDGEWVYPAAYVADGLGLTAGQVRKSNARLREAGLAESGPLFSEDDGKLAGHGTWLSCIGRRLQPELNNGVIFP